MTSLISHFTPRNACIEINLVSFCDLSDVHLHCLLLCTLTTNRVAHMQVNSGVLSVCTAFLSGEPATRLRSQELQQLIAALLEFMAVCKRAIRVHFRLIGEEDQDFHTQLVNGFQSLTAELSHYIPAILSEL